MLAHGLVVDIAKYVSDSGSNMLLLSPKLARVGKQQRARRDVTNVGDDGVDLELAAALSSAAPPLAIVLEEGLESARKTLSLSKDTPTMKGDRSVLSSLACLVFKRFLILLTPPAMAYR